MSSRPLPTILDHGTRAALLEGLRSAGFDEIHCPSRLGVASMRDALRPVQVLRSVGALAKVKPRTGDAGDALDLLLALLVFGEPVPAARLADELGAAFVAALEALQLVAPAAGAFTAHHILLPWHGLYLVTDRLEDDPATNRVMPLFAESYDLPDVTARRSVDAALDLCTGSGVHALLAHAHAREVVGIDISERAVAFARFNAWLNDVGNARFVEGDLYGPVAGSAARYGLITANPPYNPEVESAAGSNYHSGGETGEEVLSRIVSGLPDFLAEGGLAQIITLIVHRADDSIQARLRGWAGARGEGLDVLLLVRDVGYRPQVLADAAGLSPADRALAASWKRQRITRFQFGVINLRWTPPGRAPLFVEAPFGGAAGPGVVAMERVMERLSAQPPPDGRVSDFEALRAL